MNEMKPIAYILSEFPPLVFLSLSLLFTLHVSQICMAIYGNYLWKFITMTALHSRKQVLVQCDTWELCKSQISFYTLLPQLWSIRSLILYINICITCICIHAGSVFSL